MNPIPASPRRRLPWRQVPICILAGLLLATVFALRQPDLFSSEAILVRSAKVQFSGTRPIQEEAFSNEQMLALMQTEVVINRVMAKLKENRDNTNALVRPDLDVQAGRGNTFILRVTTTNFSYAQQFVTAWASEFVDFQKQQRRGMVSTTKAQTETQILLYERRLEQAQQALDGFRRKNNIAILNDADSGSRSVLEKTQQEFLALKTEQDLLQRARPEAMAANAGRVLDLRFDVKKAENRLAVLPAGASAEQRAQTEVELKLKQADLQSFLTLIGEAHRGQLEMIEDRLRSFPERLAELRASIFESADLRNQLLRLENDERNIQENLLGLKSNLESMGRVMADEEDFAVVQAGTGAPRPVGPNRPLMLVTGFGIGGLIGLLLVVLKALFGRRGGPPNPPAIPAETPAPALG
jgi:hypothetical protein